MCHLTFINKNIFSVCCSRFSRRHRHPWRTWRLGVHSSSPYDALLRQVLMFWHFSSSHFGNLIFCRPLASSSGPRTAVRSDTFSVHPSGCDAPAGFCSSTRWPRSGLRKINIITDFFRPYFCPLPFRLTQRFRRCFSWPSSRARVICARGSVYFSIISSYVLYHTAEYMRERGMGEESTSRPCSEKAFVGKSHTPIFTPTNTPNTILYGCA